MSTEYTPARATDDESTSVVGAAREGYQSSRAAMESEDGRSIGQILGDVSRDVSTLMRQEVALAKAEARQSAAQAGKGIGMLVGAGVAGILCLVFISLSAAVGLGQFIGEGAQPSGVQWGALIVAIVWAIIAAILLTVGRSEMKRSVACNKPPTPWARCPTH